MGVDHLLGRYPEIVDCPQNATAAFAAVADVELPELDVGCQVHQARLLGPVQQRVGLFPGDDAAMDGFVENAGDRGDGQADIRGPVTGMADERALPLADAFVHAKGLAVFNDRGNPFVGQGFLAEWDGLLHGQGLHELGLVCKKLAAESRPVPLDRFREFLVHPVKLEFIDPENPGQHSKEPGSFQFDHHDLSRIRHARKQVFQTLCGSPRADGDLPGRFKGQSQVAEKAGLFRRKHTHQQPDFHAAFRRREAVRQGIQHLSEPVVDFVIHGESLQAP